MYVIKTVTFIMVVGIVVVFSADTAEAKNKSSTSLSTCVIKGNISAKKEKIYHLPGCASYSATIISPSKGERLFCTEKEARDAGWRKAMNCPK